MQCDFCSAEIPDKELVLCVFKKYGGGEERIFLCSDHATKVLKYVLRQIKNKKKSAK